MVTLRLLIATAGVAVALPNIATAQTAAYPPAGYAPLLFDAADTKYVFRLNGVPWLCRGDTFCKPIKIDGVADKDLAQATIESLGFAGPRYFLSYKQANFEKGKEVALSCVEERCGKLDGILGDTSLLGTYQVKQGDRLLTRTALLRQNEAKAGRAQLLWCTETDCAELPLTRDTESYLSYMGSGRADGRTVAWLRDKSGVVLSCAQAEEGVSDQLACEKTKMVLSDFPAAATATAAAPPPPAAPAPAAPAPAANDAERVALAASIDRAIVAGDFATADRLMADATRRFAGYSAWPPLQQRLAKARADVRQAEARRLINEARRFARAGDFNHAEAMLQEADKQMPGFAETAQARAEIANLRTAQGQRFRERPQLEAAIDQALAANRLFEAERLLADYAQRYGQDGDYRARASRLAALRGTAPNQAGVAEARTHIASARQAMARNDFNEADRHLDLADKVAPGFPEIAQARADLARRIAEVRRNPPPQTGNLPPPPGPGPRSQ
jgi:tetratricopeptide (TPR) repeat protein